MSLQHTAPAWLGEAVHLTRETIEDLSPLDLGLALKMALHPVTPEQLAEQYGLPVEQLQAAAWRIQAAGVEMESF